MLSMQELKGRHWQDWVNLVLAIWLFVSPWALGFADMQTPAWDTWIFGVVIAALAIAALVRFMRWEEWLAGVIGLWLIIAPWVLNFAATTPVAMGNHVIVGILVIVLAGLELWMTTHEPPRLTA